MADAKRNQLVESPPGVSEAQKMYPEFQRLLHERERQIIDAGNHERKQLDTQVMDSPGDVGDTSVVDTGADYYLHLAENHSRELGEIRDALDKIRRGAYGECESCENPIDVERLRRLPIARLCIDCQSTREARTRSARLRELPKI